MNCPNQLTYTIKPGDNLYRLSRQFDTSVQLILSLNPGISPYNLQIGAALEICPGGGSVPVPETPAPVTATDCGQRVQLENSMRLAWSQHVYWTRMLMISIIERLRDESAVTARLLQNPNDIANVFAAVYTRDIADAVARLLTEHLQIGAELITALRDGETARAEALDRRWYQNADDITDALYGINPHYSKEDLRAMLYTHLDLTKREVAMRLAGDYAADIKAFNAVEAEAMEMADYLASGIMRQFAERFV